LNLLPADWAKYKGSSNYHWPNREWAEEIARQGFHYMVLVAQNGKLIWLKDSFLPGIVPEHRIAQTYSPYVNEVLGLCASCSGAIGHVIDETGNKFCPILFHDLIQPRRWKVKELV
jgi:hypothetical protein